MTNMLVVGTESQIVEYVVRSRVECASLCAAHFMCSHVNVIKSSPGVVTCQLVLIEGTGHAANITNHGQVYNIYNRN